MSGVIEKTHTHGRFEQIELHLNYYGLAQALTKSGLIPDGFQIERAYFDVDSNSPTVIQITLRKEVLDKDGL